MIEDRLYMIEPVQVIGKQFWVGGEDVYQLDGLPLYDSTTHFTLGARVIYGQFIYESVQNNNHNHQPDLSPTWWLFVRPEAHLCPYDNSRSTRVYGSVGSAPQLRLLLFENAYPTSEDQKYDFCAIEGLENAESVTLSFAAGPNYPAYTKTVQLGELRTASFFSFFFEGKEYAKTVIFSDFGIRRTSFNIARLSVVAKAGMQCSLSNITWGIAQDIGSIVQKGVKIGAKSYSERAEDGFGQVRLRKVRSARRFTVPAWLEIDKVDFTRALLESADASPRYYHLESRIKSLSFTGFYEDFDILTVYDNYADCNITLQEL